MAKILIVEDDKIIHNMYRVKFTNAGYEVQIAENGEDGLKFMESFKPDIVLMDLMMPIMDGFTALRKAKASPEINTIPIIILTNLAQAEDAEKILEMGAIDCIIKSNISPAEVLAKVTKFLSSSTTPK